MQAQFDIEHLGTIRHKLTEAGLDGGEELVLRRLISATGRSRAYVNGVMVPSDPSQHHRWNGRYYGQNAQYSLMSREAHVELVDRIGGLIGLRTQVEQGYHRYRALEDKASDLKALTRERTEREDFIRFQLKELEEANLLDEDEESLLEDVCPD